MFDKLLIGGNLLSVAVRCYLWARGEPGWHLTVAAYNVFVVMFMLGRKAP